MNDRKEKQRNYKSKIAYSYTIKSDYKAKTFHRANVDALVKKLEAARS